MGLTCSSSSGASSETAATSILGSLTFTFVAPALTVEQVVTALRVSLTLYLHVPESCILVSVSWARHVQQAETSIENSAYTGTWNVTYEVEVPAQQALVVQSVTREISRNRTDFEKTFGEQLMLTGADNYSVAAFAMGSFEEAAEVSTLTTTLPTAAPASQTRNHICAHLPFSPPV